MHFFRNHRYRKRNTNQSKVHWGHESAALGILGLLSPSVKVLFPVWVQLLAPGGAHSVQSSSPLPLLYGLYHRPDLGCLHPRALLKWRWGLEPAFRDNKETLGFDHYQVHAQHSIERSVLLAFVAASLTRLVALPAFQKAHGPALPALGPALEKMNIHWYHPTQWTAGLILRYIRWNHQEITLFEITVDTSENKVKLSPGVELDYDLAGDWVGLNLYYILGNVGE